MKDNKTLPSPCSVVKQNKMKQVQIFFLFLAAVCVSGSQVSKCKHGKDLSANNEITLSNCEKPPCRLRRKTTVSIELKFKPEEDTKTLKNSVHAQILGLPFPFIGVDGNSICDKIFDASTGAKASCPLKGGQEYVYKDSFKILEIYPKIKVNVHWALKDDHDHDVLCFEVPARITS